MMPSAAIQIATIDALLSGEARATGASPSCVHVESLSEGGAYMKAPPFRLDVGALDAVHRPTLDQYIANPVATFGPIRHLRFKGALVVGQGSVVTSDAFLVSESAHEFLAGERVPDGLIDAGAGGLALASEPSGTIDRPTLLLRRPWNANYGHWLVDSAAMLALAAGLTLPSGWQIAIGRQAEPAMREIVRQTLDIVAPGIPVIELPDNEVWRFSELHYVSPIHVPLRFKLPAAISTLKALVLRDGLASDRPRRCIYVTRGDLGSRRLRNEEAVIALCRELGLDIVQPEQLTLIDQAGLFHEAQLVVGVKGAALTNGLFCSSRTHLVVLSPGDFPDPFYWDLTAPAGIRYSEIFGALQGRDLPTGQNPFTIPVAGLRSVLEACLRDLEER